MDIITYNVTVSAWLNFKLQVMRRQLMGKAVRVKGTITFRVASGRQCSFWASSAVGGSKSSDTITYNAAARARVLAGMKDQLTLKCR
mmetsp:Transcript_59038/g.191187  ORF Transcript_59038/g.191187 Transcript_59038/m.191187 type:complete len:87 (-) Transcript_59038:568-828(-)